LDPATQSEVPGPEALETERFERKDMVVLERRAGLVILGALGITLPLLAWMFLGVAIPEPLLIVGPLAAIGFAFLTILTFYRWPQRRTAHVVADASGLTLDGKHPARTGSQHAFTMILPDGAWGVRVEDRRWVHAITLVVQDAAEAESILRALRMDVSHATVTFTATKGGQRGHIIRTLLCVFAYGVLTALGIVLGRFLPALRHQSFLLWPTLLGPLVVGSARVTVGADGVLIRPYLGRRRFLPYANILSAELEANDVVLTLRSGKPVRFGMGNRQFDSAGQAFVQRIRTGKEEQGSGVAPPSPAALVARGQRSVRAWLAGLQELAGLERATYRRPVVPAEQFWRIVEDARGAPEVRAGAAVALRSSLDGEGRERLRVASEACASPKLRAAFDAVRSEKGEAAVEEALEAVTVTDGKQGQRVPRWPTS
jgi:hypothetical protein